MPSDPHGLSSADVQHATPPMWLYALALLALAAIGFAFGDMAEAARRSEPGGIDRTIPLWIRFHSPHHRGLTRLFHAVTLLGNFAVGDALILLTTLALVVLHRERLAGIRRADAFLWVGVTMGGRLLNVFLKVLFNRRRPPLENWLIFETGLSFPSGHAVFAGVFFGMLALLFARPAAGKPWWLRLVGAAGCLAMAALVASSRVWLGVHYPTDVIGGLLLGLGWVISAWLIRSSRARWYYHRRLAQARAAASPAEAALAAELDGSDDPTSAWPMGARDA